MDLEAVQLLNLSPIPELSELELSTMLEQLSGLSDLNGDLTDRNVGDILKEAENLIDTSICSKITELPMTDDVVKDYDRTYQTNEEPAKMNEAQESLSDAKNSNSAVESIKSSPKKTQEIDMHLNSPTEQSNKIFSPGGCSNPIKSTIDSLKEFSSIVERQLSSRSSGSLKENHNEDNINKLNERDKNPKPILKNSKNAINEKKNFESVKTSKATKLLSCFERLYQDRPNRHKTADKITKTMVKKKNVSKSQVKLGKTSSSRNSEEMKDKLNERIDNCLPKHYLEVENWLRGSNSKCQVQSNYKFDIPLRRVEGELENEFVLHNQRNEFKIDECSRASSQIDEKLILKLLQGMEEIKDHVKRAGAVKMIQENQAVIDNLRSEVESVREKVTSERMKNVGIERLEEQFAILKNKYDQHMKKLEAENLKLREALSQNHNVSNTECGCRVEPNIGDRKITRSFSLENCAEPKNSPRSSIGEIQPSTQKEACSQTDKELRNISIQCFEEPKFEEVTIEEEEDTGKTENKENLTARRKPTKERPFSEKNVQQLLKQKKFSSGYETQLLATLRGLQSEINVKEKENRKLKTEIDLLKSQVKKSGKRVEGNIRRHIGTQTIALGHVVQKPYNPELFEVPMVFEKENEELKGRIKSLEEDFETLKEKRITDLQALHQVHEEEMSKLLSKLETQSALTKHLHSLLVNR